MKTPFMYTLALFLLFPLLSLQSCDLFGGSSPLPLELSLTVQKEQTLAKLTLTVKNTGTQPITLDFDTGQRFDFIAQETGTHRLYWRWSYGQFFVMVLGQETIEPGATVTFDAEMSYAGLPPTRYDILGILVSKPNSFSSRSVAIDLTDKPLPKEGLEILGEVILLPPDHPCCGGPAIESLSGQMYLFQNVPPPLWDAVGFPIRAWLRAGTKPDQYEVIDYVWVIAPLDENRPSIGTFVQYSKSGGIAGLIQIIKVYADGSFLIQCCIGGKDSRAGFIGLGQFELITDDAQAQGFWDLQSVYGQLGAVADGFTENITIQLPDKPVKSVTVYQDPNVQVPSAFTHVAERIASLIGL